MESPEWLDYAELASEAEDIVSTLPEPVAARTVSDGDAWGDAARRVLPSILESDRVRGMSRPLGSESTVQGRYARTESRGGEDTRRGMTSEHYVSSCRDCREGTHSPEVPYALPRPVWCQHGNRRALCLECHS